MSRQKKSPPKVDPFAKREAQNYENPIPSREFIMDHLAKVGKPMTLQQIADLLKLDKEQMEALRRRLRAMERDGQLIRNRRKGYGLAKKMDLVRGRVIGHPDGYGFLVPDEGGTDLFLSQKEMRSLMHGDRALVNIIGVDNKGRREGALVEVLEHSTQEVVGRYFHKKGQNVAFVEPDNRRIPHNILIEGAKKKQCEAKHGQIVVVRLLSPPTKYNPPFGEVIEIIGNHRDPGMEINIAIRAHELPHIWSDEVLAEAAKFTKEIPEVFLEDREDLRDTPFVTIDGKDAKDFDDAVQCQPRGKGWLLRVAIADVSTYVDTGTAIDLEARNRGNSVYFPNRVIPMLPVVLSNKLCSLKPNVDRLCLVCELAIDFYGRTRRTRFFKAVIRSAARLTYIEVAKVLEGHEKIFRHPHLLPQIQNLYSLYQLLLKRRKKRGAIDFETIEPRFIFNRQQKIEQIVPMERNDAHKLIEEMMLAANVATAEWLKKQKMPLLYRIHEGPTEEKLTALRGFLKELGLSIWGKDKPQAPHYAKLLEKVHERLDYRLIQTMLLRSLRLAIYTPENKGHFGLAYSAYAHFTSPIRRYPDLLVHRAIHHRLKGLPADEFTYTNHEIEILGEHCSMTERRADESTRDAISMLKCEYMQDKIGEKYDGIVTGVTAFGIFVELDGVFIDGLVHVTALKEDYYHFDPIGQRLYGESSGTTYRISDRVRVKVIRVDLEEKKIDFELA